MLAVEDGEEQNAWPLIFTMGALNTFSRDSSGKNEALMISFISQIGRIAYDDLCPVRRYHHFRGFRCDINKTQALSMRSLHPDSAKVMINESFY